jgi:hypothetical protein
MTRDFTLTFREGPRVAHEHAATLDSALAVLEARMRELAATVRRPEVDLRYRRFAPIQQVAARAELSGPGRVRGGLDLRGDGSVEAFTGRLRRRVVTQREGETAYDALRRALGPGDGSTSAGP